MDDEQTAKEQFILEEAQKQLDASVEAYSSIDKKSFQLFTVFVPILTALAAFIIYKADFQSLVYWAAFAYTCCVSISLSLLLSSYFPKKIQFKGNYPQHFFSPEVFKYDLHKIMHSESKRYDRAITLNLEEVETKASLFNKALLILILSPPIIALVYLVLILVLQTR